MPHIVLQAEARDTPTTSSGARGAKHEVVVTMQKTSSSLCSLLSRASRFVRSSSFDDGGCVFRLWIGADPSTEGATTSASRPANSMPFKARLLVDAAPQGLRLLGSFRRRELVPQREEA